MKALYILTAGLLILFLIGQIRVGVRAEYNADGLRAWARVGVIRIQVYPWNKKEAKPQPKPKKQKKSKQAAPEPPARSTAQKLGGALDYAKALLPIALEAAGQFKQNLRMDTLYLEVTAGSPDPADTAMLYGQASAALGAFWYPLTRAFHVKDGNARVNADFEATSMTLYGTVSLSLKIGQILWLGLYFGIKALRAFLTVRTTQKQKQQQRKAA